jgi:hypothetical protein
MKQVQLFMISHAQASFSVPVLQGCTEQQKRPNIMVHALNCVHRWNQRPDVSRLPSLFGLNVTVTQDSVHLGIVIG